MAEDYLILLSMFSRCRAQPAVHGSIDIPGKLVTGTIIRTKIARMFISWAVVHPSSFILSSMSIQAQELTEARWSFHLLGCWGRDIALIWSRT